MTTEHSVSEWIDQAKQGDQVAMGKIYARYFEKLCFVAKNQLKGFPQRVADYEDAVAIALEDFRIRVSKGDYDTLTDRNDLWRLLIAVTSNKVCDMIRRQLAQKRGGGKTRGDSINFNTNLDSNNSFDRFVGMGRTPEAEVALSEQLQLVLGDLGDDDLKRIALARLDGSSNQEIASSLNTSLSTVERRINLIKKKLHSRLKHGNSK